MRSSPARAKIDFYSVLFLFGARARKRDATTRPTATRQCDELSRDRRSFRELSPPRHKDTPRRRKQRSLSTSAGTNWPQELVRDGGEPDAIIHRLGADRPAGRLRLDTVVILSYPCRAKRDTLIILQVRRADSYTRTAKFLSPRAHSRTYRREITPRRRSRSRCLSLSARTRVPCTRCSSLAES